VEKAEVRMIKQNLQSLKPRARQIKIQGRLYWKVHGTGITSLHRDCDQAYKAWVEEYMNRALYGTLAKRS
jgi:hypothetical protein